ncbi:MAG TPA: hypothetical protein VL945_00375 [Candidatus Saccharimonadales bacterium]|nr:hypothetical protein [Candidatus Saccharimonadales bacterium]
MNIGIDFDNTITENPALFRKLTNSLRKGNVIYVISSSDKAEERDIEREREGKVRRLKAWRIHYRKLFLALRPIPESKAAMCRKYKIDLMIDDNRENVRAIRRRSKRTACMEFAYSAGGGR